MPEDDDRVFDRRIVDRNIDKDLITEDDYDAYLDDLDDQADSADTIEAQFEHGVLDDDEDRADDEQAGSEEPDDADDAAADEE